MNADRGHRRRSRTAMAVLSMTLLVGAAGCGADEPEQPQAGPGGVMPGDKVPAQDYTKRVAAGMKGLTTLRSTVAMEGDGQEITGTSVQDFTTDPASFRSTYTVNQTSTFALTMVDGLLYFRPPGRRDYLRMDPDRLTGPMAQVDLEQLTEMADVSAATEMMERAITKVTYQGSEDVTGAMTDRYEVTLDPRKLSNPAGTPVPKRMTMNFWLDADDGLRRMSMVQDGMTMRVEAEGYGGRVRIAPPPASRVTDQMNPAG